MQVQSSPTLEGGHGRVKSESMDAHRTLSSSLLGLPYRILIMNHKKELLRGLWICSTGLRFSSSGFGVFVPGVVT